MEVFLPGGSRIKWPDLDCTVAEAKEELLRGAEGFGNESKFQPSEWTLKAVVGRSGFTGELYATNEALKLCVRRRSCPSHARLLPFGATVHGSRVCCCCACAPPLTCIQYRLALCEVLSGALDHRQVQSGAPRAEPAPWQVGQRCVQTGRVPLSRGGTAAHMLSHRLPCTYRLQKRMAHLQQVAVLAGRSFASNDPELKSFHNHMLR